MLKPRAESGRKKKGGKVAKGGGGGQTGVNTGVLQSGVLQGGQSAPRVNTGGPRAP